MNFPEELKYHEKHLWVKIEKNKAVIGITDYAQSQLGNIVYVELPNEGEKVMQNKSFCQVESAKVVTEFVSPLSGKITKINSGIIDEPEKLNSDPYGEGWLITIEMANQDEVESLLSVASYINSFREIIT